MPPAVVRWTTAHSADISATLERGQVVSVQIAWHAGWNATANGNPVPVRRDGLGLMYVEPDVSGPCQINIFYNGGAEMRFAWAICAITVILLAGASARAILKKSW
jgi:hypothetical protein